MGEVKATVRSGDYYERLEKISSHNFTEEVTRMGKYPTIIEGRLSYDLLHNDMRSCGAVDIPQELAEEFMALLDKIERFNEEKSM